MNPGEIAVIAGIAGIAVIAVIGRATAKPALQMNGEER